MFSFNNLSHFTPLGLYCFILLFLIILYLFFVFFMHFTEKIYILRLFYYFFYYFFFFIMLLIFIIINNNNFLYKFFFRFFNFFFEFSNLNTYFELLFLLNFYFYINFYIKIFFINYFFMFINFFYYIFEYTLRYLFINFNSFFVFIYLCYLYLYDFISCFYMFNIIFLYIHYMSKFIFGFFLKFFEDESFTFRNLNFDDLHESYFITYYFDLFKIHIINYYYYFINFLEYILYDIFFLIINYIINNSTFINYYISFFVLLHNYLYNKNILKNLFYLYISNFKIYKYINKINFFIFINFKIIFYFIFNLYYWFLVFFFFFLDIFIYVLKFLLKYLLRYVLFYFIILFIFYQLYLLFFNFPFFCLIYNFYFIIHEYLGEYYDKIFYSSIFVLHNLKISFFYFYRELLVFIKLILIPFGPYSKWFYYIEAFNDILTRINDVFRFLILNYLLLNYLSWFAMFLVFSVFLYMIYFSFFFLLYCLLKVCLIISFFCHNYFLVYYWLGFYNFIDFLYTLNCFYYIYDFYFLNIEQLIIMLLENVHPIFLILGNWLRLYLLFYLLFIYEESNKKLKFIFNLNSLLKISPFYRYNLYISKDFFFDKINENNLFLDLFRREYDSPYEPIRFSYDEWNSHISFWNNRLLSYDPLFQDANLEFVQRYTYSLLKKKQLDYLLDFSVTNETPLFEDLDLVEKLNWLITTKLFNYNLSKYMFICDSWYKDIYEMLNEEEEEEPDPPYIIAEDFIFSNLLYLESYRDFYLVNNNTNKADFKLFCIHFKHLVSLNQFQNVKNDLLNHFAESLFTSFTLNYFNIFFLNTYAYLLFICTFSFFNDTTDLFIFDFFILNTIDLIFNIYNIISLPLFIFSFTSNFFFIFWPEEAKTFYNGMALYMYFGFDTLDYLSFDFFSTIFYGLKYYSLSTYVNIFNNYFYYLTHYAFNTVIILLNFFNLLLIKKFFYKKNKIFLISNFYENNDLINIFKKYKRNIKFYFFNY